MGTGVRTAHLGKNRNGPALDPLAFTIRAEALGEDEDGDPITAPVVVEPPRRRSAPPSRSRLASRPRGGSWRTRWPPKASLSRRRGPCHRSSAPCRSSGGPPSARAGTSVRRTIRKIGATCSTGSRRSCATGGLSPCRAGSHGCSRDATAWRPARQACDRPRQASTRGDKPRQRREFGARARRDRRQPLKGVCRLSRRSWL